MTSDVFDNVQESVVMEWPILMMLYVLQGVVFGVVGGVQMLMIPRLSTSQHATLGQRMTLSKEIMKKIIKK